MEKKQISQEQFSDNKINKTNYYNINMMILEDFSPDVKQYDRLVNLINIKIYDRYDYIKRLIKEFKLITYFGFIQVFEQVKEILKLTSEYPHIIRGSAGSCLLCYYMGITNIDPIKENISLSRFMHKNREDIPDIDIDFPANDRDKIYRDIFTKWNNKVARISNHIKYKEKSALREAIRNAGYRKFVPKNFKLENLFADRETIKKIQDNAKKILGNFRCHSLHCGGIVIFNSKVPQNLVLKDYEVLGTTGKQIWMDKNQVEDADMIKIDILSNRGLSQLIDIDKKNINKYTFDDTNTYKLFASGNNIGITHSESRAMMKVFRTMKPKSIKELAIALALIRPAASKNYQKSYFLRDYSPYKYDKGKYIIFDDDATRYIKKILKCSESKADIYRKAFSKNKEEKKKEFIKKYTKIESNVNIREKTIERLEQLQYYSFCKSHAYSYAQLIYCLAYQKLYNPIKFWLSTLNNCNTSYRKWVHFREAHKSGIKLSVGRKPFKICNNILVPSKKFKKVITQPFDQLKYYGYWTCESFLSGMYYVEYWEKITQKHKNLENTFRKDDKVLYSKFSGIIATGRICKQEAKRGFITFVTIGIDDGIYYDLVLYGYNKIASYNFINGYGKVKKSGNCIYIDVHKFNLFNV